MIKIKPHHFVDIITKFGDKSAVFKPHPYGHALHSVAKEILDNRDIDICIELGADDICLPCCHNIEGMCDDIIDISFRPQAPRSKREYNLLIDERWCKKLGIKQNNQLTARALSLRIRDGSDHLSDIYLEMPAERTIERQTKLKRGINKFLDEEQTINLR